MASAPSFPLTSSMTAREYNAANQRAPPQAAQPPPSFPTGLSLHTFTARTPLSCGSCRAPSHPTTACTVSAPPPRSHPSSHVTRQFSTAYQQPHPYLQSILSLQTCVPQSTSSCQRGSINKASYPSTRQEGWSAIISTTWAAPSPNAASCTSASSAEVHTPGPAHTILLHMQHD